MTREEAIDTLKNGVWWDRKQLDEAIDIAISALRPVSRERVEKVWRGKYGKESKISFDCDGKSPLCECPHMMLTHQWDEYCSFGERKRISHEE